MTRSETVSFNHDCTSAENEKISEQDMAIYNEAMMTGLRVTEIFVPILKFNVKELMSREGIQKVSRQTG